MALVRKFSNYSHAPKFLAQVQGGFERLRVGGNGHAPKSAMSQYYGLAPGDRSPASWIQPFKDGGCRLYITTGGSMSANAAGSYANGTLTVNGAATVSMNAYMTSERTLTINGAGSMTANPAGSRGNITLTVRIGFQPSADENADAVFSFPVEGSLTMRDVMRVLLSVAAGKTTIGTGDPVVVAFRDQADTKDRVSAEMSGSERTSVTLDGS